MRYFLTSYVVFGMLASPCLAQTMNDVQQEDCSSSIVLNGLTYSGSNINKISYISLINDKVFETLKQRGGIEFKRNISRIPK